MRALDDPLTQILAAALGNPEQPRLGGQRLAPGIALVTPDKILYLLAQSSDGFPAISI